MTDKTLSAKSLSPHKSNITVDIIYVNYNSTSLLIKSLHSVMDSIMNFDLSIYVQDNASKDRVCRSKSLFPDIILSINKQNLGFAKAVNNALMMGTGDYVILLNPDTYVTRDFFNDSIRFMESAPDVGVIGPRILDTDGRLQNSARSFPTPLTAFFGRSSFLSRKFPQNPITSKNLLSLQSDGENPMEVDWVSGACMVIRRNTIEKVGLLDERFFMYWEDADWCRRFWRAQSKVVYYPKTKVYHYVGGSSEKRVFRSLVDFHRSVYLLFDKHSHASFAFFKPLVLWGLLIRLFFVSCTQFAQRKFKALKPKHRTGMESKSKIASRRRIKVLRIISRMNIGGPAIHVYLLTVGLDPRRFESKLITGKISSGEGDMSYLFENSTQKPIVMPSLQREISILSDLKTFAHLFRILVREQPDIVHTHTAKAGSSMRLAAFLYNGVFRRKVKIVHTFHGHVFEGYFSRLYSVLFINIERFLARISDAIIAISPTQKDALSTKFRIAGKDKIHTIELGFDLTPFVSCGSLRNRFRKTYAISESAFIVGIIGRLVPIKNHKMFFRSAARFIAKHPDAEIKFVVIGDGELKEQLIQYCRELGLSGHTIFCGWVRQAAAIYADLNVLALTSLNEGTPVSIIESMAAGVPVVATDAGGVRDLFGCTKEDHFPDGFAICERGILCAPNDHIGFANGLSRLFTGKKVDVDRIIQNARSFAVEHYDRKRLYRDMESLYENLVQRR